MRRMFRIRATFLIAFGLLVLVSAKDLEPAHKKKNATTQHPLFAGAAGAVAAAAASSRSIGESTRTMTISLADRLEQLTPTDKNGASNAALNSDPLNSDFLYRLRREEDEAIRIQETKHDRRTWKFPAPEQLTFLWQSAVVSLLLMAAANLLSGTSVSWSSLARDIRQAMKQAIAVNGPIQILQWIRRSGGSSSSESTPVHRTWSQNVALFFVTFAKPDLIRYLWNTVVPTMRKMVVTEVWNRFFAKVFKATSVVGSTFLTALTAYVLGDSSSSSSIMGGFQSAAASSPWWLREGQSILTTAVQKGTKKIFQSALQHHLHAAVVTVLEYTRDVALDQIQLQQLVVRTDAVPSERQLQKDSGNDIDCDYTENEEDQSGDDMDSDDDEF